MAASINISAYSDVLVVLGTAGVVVPLFRRLGLSSVLGYLGAGALLGPLGVGQFIPKLPLLYWITIVDTKSVSAIADLGVVFLLFLVGIELSYERLMSMRRLVFGLGSLQILLSTLALAAIALLFGQTPAISVMLGSCLALSSTAVVLDVLTAQGRLKTTSGRTSFSILLAQDLAVVPILMFISILASNGEGSVWFSIGSALLRAVAAVGIIVLVGRLLLRPLFRLVGSLRSAEVLLAASLFVVILTGVVAAVAGLSMALGAFVAGLLLAETEYRKAIEAMVDPFKALLLGLFFFSVGMSIDLREIMKQPLALLAAVLLVVLLKAAITTGLSRLYKISWPASIETGLMLGPGGEFAFVGISTAAALGLITSAASSFILAVTSLSMALIPVLSLVAARINAAFIAKKLPDPALLLQPAPQQKHAILIGYGRIGKVVADLFKVHKVPYTATDQNAHSVSQDRANGHEVFYGDATSLLFLQNCGLMEANAVIITIGTRSVLEEVVRKVRLARPDIHIIARAQDADHARHLYKIGVTEAVPETIEASLQISEAALLDLGIAAGYVIASIHEKRDVFRAELQQAAREVGIETTRAVKAKRKFAAKSAE